MLHKFPVGSKEQNDLLILPQGAICIDGNESLRIHNGIQSGGGVIELEVAVPPPAPAFKGEVHVGDLINGTDLAALVGLTAGTIIDNTDNEPWLHFVDPVDNKTKYIAKKPYRRSISWDDINAVDCVYGKTITIGDNQYICRLIKGGKTEPFTGLVGHDTEGTWGSEWNRLLYPICAPTGNPDYDNIQDPSSPGLGTWAQYDQTNDLGLMPGIGARSLCQNFHKSSRIYRGSVGVTNSSTITPHSSIQATGWRPLLELIETTISTVGQRDWLVPGTYIWTVPEGIYSINCLVVGSGARGYWLDSHNRRGGAGGQVRWQNNISVTPGQEITITVADVVSSVTSSNSSLGTSGRNSSSILELSSSSQKDGIDIFGGDGANGTQGNTTNAAQGGSSGRLTTDGSSTPNMGIILTTGEISDSGLGVGGGVNTSSSNITAQAGNAGGVRIIWGPNRAYPDLNIHDMY